MARFRFTSRKSHKKVAGIVLHLDRSAMPPKTRVSSRGTLLKVLAVYGKQIAYEPAGDFKRCAIAVAFLTRHFVNGAQASLKRGARCAASTSVVCRNRLRCLERGLRLATPADSRCGEHSPQ